MGAGDKKQERRRSLTRRILALETVQESDEERRRSLTRRILALETVQESDEDVASLDEWNGYTRFNQDNFVDVQELQENALEELWGKPPPVDINNLTARYVKALIGSRVQGVMTLQELEPNEEVSLEELVDGDLEFHRTMKERALPFLVSYGIEVGGKLAFDVYFSVVMCLVKVYKAFNQGRDPEFMKLFKREVDAMWAASRALKKLDGSRSKYAVKVGHQEAGLFVESYYQGVRLHILKAAGTVLEVPDKWTIGLNLYDAKLNPDATEEDKSRSEAILRHLVNVHAPLVAENYHSVRPYSSVAKDGVKVAVTLSSCNLFEKKFWKKHLKKYLSSLARMRRRLSLKHLK